jgi:hypothetical protein
MDGRSAELSYEHESGVSCRQDPFRVLVLGPRWAVKMCTKEDGDFGENDVTAIYYLLLMIHVS